MIIQTIDVNQDSVISQSFFVPNVLGEFELDKNVKIVGCPEFIITTDWSSTAWCSAFSERTFGTLSQRAYARMNIRLHYGHPDYLDALWVMVTCCFTLLN
jgi:1,3-beta-glucan synthase